VGTEEEWLSLGADPKRYWNLAYIDPSDARYWHDAAMATQHCGKLPPQRPFVMRTFKSPEFRLSPCNVSPTLCGHMCFALCQTPPPTTLLLPLAVPWVQAGCTWVHWQHHLLAGQGRDLWLQGCAPQEHVELDGPHRGRVPTGHGEVRAVALHQHLPSSAVAEQPGAGKCNVAFGSVCAFSSTWSVVQPNIGYSPPCLQTLYVNNNGTPFTRAGLSVYFANM